MVWLVSIGRDHVPLLDPLLSPEVYLLSLAFKNRGRGRSGGRAFQEEPCQQARVRAAAGTFQNQENSQEDFSAQSAGIQHVVSIHFVPGAPTGFSYCNSHHELAASASHPSFTEQETEAQKGGDWSVAYLVKGRCGFALETPCFRNLRSFRCTYSSSPAGLLILQGSASDFFFAPQGPRSLKPGLGLSRLSLVNLDLRVLDTSGRLFLPSPGLCPVQAEGCIMELFFFP